VQVPLPLQQKILSQPQPPNLLLQNAHQTLNGIILPLLEITATKTVMDEGTEAVTAVGVNEATLLEQMIPR